MKRLCIYHKEKFECLEQPDCSLCEYYIQLIKENKTNKQKIRTELERLKNELIANNENTMFEQGRISAFEDALLFVDSTPEEPVIEDILDMSNYINIENSGHSKIMIYFSKLDSTTISNTKKIIGNYDILPK